MPDVSSVTRFINNPYACINLDYTGITEHISYKFSVSRDYQRYTKHIRELANVALAFLNFYQPTARCLFTGSKIAEIYKYKVEGETELGYDNKTVAYRKFLFATGSAISAVSSFFSYRVGLGAALSNELICNATTIALEIFKEKRDGELMKKALLLIAKDLMGLVTVVVPSPKLFVISFVAQTALVGYETYQKANKGSLSPTRKVEMAIRILLLGGYGYQLKQQVQLANFI